MCADDTEREMEKTTENDHCQEQILILGLKRKKEAARIELCRFTAEKFMHNSLLLCKERCQCSTKPEKHLLFPPPHLQAPHSSISPTQALEAVASMSANRE